MVMPEPMVDVTGSHRVAVTLLKISRVELHDSVEMSF
jgi:hypothetical protein